LLLELHRLLDAVRYLFTQLRELLEVVLLCSRTRRSEVQTVLELLEEAIRSAPTPLQKEIQRVIKQVRLALAALFYFAEEVEACQQEAIPQVGEAALGLIAWAWQRRTILGELPQQLLAMLDPACLLLGCLKLGTRRCAPAVSSRTGKVLSDRI
jgi:hypothetical protein